jgi:cobyrinic acid a,c-diamide synthase
MPPDVCRDVFARGCRHAELAVVEGTLEEVGPGLGPYPFVRPGRLGPIAETLDLPLIALVDCPATNEFHLPRLSAPVDGILLDNLACAADFDRIRQLISHVWKRPVIGAVEALPEERLALSKLTADATVPDAIVGRLAHSFLKFADLSAIRAVAEARPLTARAVPPGHTAGRRFRVAYAHDEAFGAYFPDTLETLEALGAELVEFSPLRDEALPRGADLVMIGCGFPDKHAEALTANLSLISALRQHVCQGNRIYSEGGGTAYLGRSMILEDKQVPAAGILPFDAVVIPGCKAPKPVIRTLLRDGWLGAAGTAVRGYRSMRWKLLPAADPDDCPAVSGALARERDIYFRHHAVGSLIHLHLASLPQVVSAFAGHRRPTLTLPRMHP